MDLPSYLVFSLCNGLWVFTFRTSIVTHSKVLLSRWRFVTIPNQSYDHFWYWIGLRCNSSYLVRPRLSVPEYFLSFIRFVSCREEVRRAAYAGMPHQIFPITCIWFNDIRAPSAIIIAGVFAQFRVSWFSSEISKSHRHWSSGLAIEHCFNALFWTSVGTQANTVSWYLYFSSENLPGSSGSAFLQVKHAWETRFHVA